MILSAILSCTPANGLTSVLSVTGNSLEVMLWLDTAKAKVGVREEDQAWEALEITRIMRVLMLEKETKAIWTASCTRMVPTKETLEKKISAVLACRASKRRMWVRNMEFRKGTQRIYARRVPILLQVQGSVSLLEVYIHLLESRGLGALVHLQACKPAEIVRIPVVLLAKVHRAKCLDRVV